MEVRIVNTAMTGHIRASVDLAIDEGPEPDKRFVVITIPKKQEIAAFKRDYHGKDARGLLDAAAAQR